MLGKDARFWMMRVLCSGLGTATVIAISATAVAPLDAQAPPQTVACRGQVISRVVIVPLAPLEKVSHPWYQAPVRVMNSTHTTTGHSIVRAFMQLKPGDRCDEFRRRESERVLRVQPFIATARVDVYADDGGTVTLVVTTRDEFTFIFATRISGRSPYVTALTIGDGDLGGRGVSLAANWTHTDTREGFGVAYSNYAFFNKPLLAQLALSRGDIGVTSYAGDIGHPYYSNAQRSAWRVAFVSSTMLDAFQRADTTPFNVAQRREFVAGGAEFRVGNPAKTVLLFGAAASTEYDATGLPALGYDSAVDYDSLFVRYAPRRSVRLNLIGQLRALTYKRAFRLGTLNGEQELRLGLELGGILGHGFSGIDGSSADQFGMGLFFLGLGGERTYSYLQGILEARRAQGSSQWSGTIGSARLVLYQRIGNTQTFVADAEFGGGWRTTRPFELDLGQPEGGVRGFGSSHDAGGQRAALKLEERWFLGRIGKEADIGLAAFVDGGRVWAGDVPYGVTSGLKIGTGIGFLAATPSGSRRTYRADIAFPITPDPYAKWEIRVTVVNIAELGARREPTDVTAGRELITTATTFTFPP
jgi:hypothetical protein